MEPREAADTAHNSDTSRAVKAHLPWMPARRRPAAAAVVELAGLAGWLAGTSRQAGWLAD